MTWPDVVDTLREVLSMNLSRLLFSFVAIMVGYAVYRVVAREIRSMTEQRLDRDDQQTFPSWGKDILQRPALPMS